MNLHSIAGPIVGAVNPPTPASLQISTGYQTAADGSRSPGYLQPAIPVTAQVQPMSTTDIQHVTALNLQGNFVAIYLNGEIDGIVRPESKGGDLVTIPAGRYAGTYLVSTVIERWDGWAKIAATLQNGA